MLNYMKVLCQIDGISGRENKVREFIISNLPKNCDYKTDNLGNLIVRKRGQKKPKSTVMLSAHMDEVGMIVTAIEEDGSLRFTSVGGVEPGVMLANRVRVNENIGVVGSKPIHMQSSEERERPAKEESLYIDIGTSTKEESEKLVSLGDSVCFLSEFRYIGKNLVKAKAIDDRFGCALLLKLLNEYDEYDLNCAFLVQEEVGLRGASAATFAIDPDIAVVFEATTAADLPEVSEQKKVCKLGDGPVIPFMDRATIYDKELFDLAGNLAKENEIQWQTKTVIAGGNDAGAIHSSKAGVKAISVSIPCRYIHSPSCMADVRDIEESYKLAKLLVSKVSKL